MHFLYCYTHEANQNRWIIGCTTSI